MFIYDFGFVKRSLNSQRKRKKCGKKRLEIFEIDGEERGLVGKEF